MKVKMENEGFCLKRGSWATNQPSFLLTSHQTTSWWSHEGEKWKWKLKMRVLVFQPLIRLLVHKQWKKWKSVTCLQWVKSESGNQATCPLVSNNNHLRSLRSPPKPGIGEGDVTNWGREREHKVNKPHPTFCKKFPFYIVNSNQKLLKCLQSSEKASPKVWIIKVKFNLTTSGWCGHS